MREPAAVTRIDADHGWEADAETGGLVRMLRDSDGLSIGLWKPNGASGKRIEYRLDADETLVVLRGSGELRVNDGQPVELRPGVIVTLLRGSDLSWLVDNEFRELWIYS